MNREVKFKGKRIDNNEWVVGDLCKMFSENNYCIMPNSFFATRDFGEEDDNDNTKIQDSLAIGGFYPVIKESLGQFTGLKDKNGVEIYEGDIIKCDDGHVRVVLFDDTVVEGCYNSGFICKDSDGQWYFDSTDIVIGNVHEHKHLLK